VPELEPLQPPDQPERSQPGEPGEDGGADDVGDGDDTEGAKGENGETGDGGAAINTDLPLAGPEKDAWASGAEVKLPSAPTERKLTAEEELAKRFERLKQLR
jgi:vacuolar protein sorting-associated protein IST1